MDEPSSRWNQDRGICLWDLHKSVKEEKKNDLNDFNYLNNMYNYFESLRICIVTYTFTFILATFFLLLLFCY